MDRREFVKYGIILAGVGGVFGFALKQIGNDFKIEKTAPDKILNAVKPCGLPFEYIEIHDGGKIYPCCPAFIGDEPFGNIVNNDFKDIWNGKRFNELRKKILKNDYSMCRRDICIYNPSEYTNKFNAAKQGPKRALLCYDAECNYKCITCRDNIFMNSDEQLKILDNVVMPRILPLLDDLQEITFSGGDPLASRHSRKLIKAVCKKNTDTKISLCTQGYFLNQKNMKELSINKLQSVSISIHSATRETYKKIMRLDAFDRIMKNLKFVVDWKKSGKINDFSINFVVHSMNYKEMIDFVKIAEKFDAIACFWTYRPWPSAKMSKHYQEVAVFQPYHKDYPKLKKILQNPIFKTPNAHLSTDLIAIADS